MQDYILLGKHCLLLGVLVVCLYTDLARGKLYDYAVLPALVLGLLLNYVVGGFWDGGLQGTNLGGALLGAGLAGGIFLWPYLRGGLGGGDVKLMAAVGALGGFHRLYIVLALVYTALIGAAMAVLLLIWHRKLWEGVKGSFRFIFSLKRVDRDKDEEESDEERAATLTVPYGTAICLGSTLAWFVTELSA